jgi:hypothetical protein
MADELEGNSLNVYAYVAKEGKPVGTRDVTRGANLSSPSVAFRHLQKLEALGLIERNAYGEYTLKQKTDVSGFVWVGKALVPRLMFYSLFFMGALGAEIATIVLSFVLSLTLELSFFFLTAMTALAMILFLSESVHIKRKVNPKTPDEL